MPGERCCAEVLLKVWTLNAGVIVLYRKLVDEARLLGMAKPLGGKDSLRATTPSARA